MRFKGILAFVLGIYVVTTAHAADTARFEYKTVVLSSLSFDFSKLEYDRGSYKDSLSKYASTLDSALNEQSKDGWRFVEILPVRGWTDRVVGYAVVFERQLQ